MCADILPNKHAQKLLELMTQGYEVFSENCSRFEIAPDGSVKYVKGPEADITPKIGQIRDQFLEEIALSLDESPDREVKQSAAEVRSRIGNAEQPEREVVKCWKNTDGKHNWRDTAIPGDASQYVQCEHCGFISLKSESTLHPFHL
jgi:hypothetical protein